MTQEEKELDKLAEKYQDDNTIIRYYGPGNGSVPEYNKTMAEVFKDGWNTCKRLMMEEAVNGWLDEDNEPPYDLNVVCEEKIPFGKFKHGDKVKLIIIPESCCNQVGRRDLQLSVDWSTNIDKVEKCAEECLNWIDALPERFNSKKHNKEMDLNDRLEEISRNGLESAHTIDFSKEYENSKQILEKGVNCKEWSEEDENKIKDIIDYLECWNDFDHGSESFEEYRKRMEGNIQFMKSLRPSWKPSEQEKGALRTAIHILTEERSFPKAAAQLQNILNAFEGKESRKEWKPSEEQMEALESATENCAYSEYQDCLCELIKQLKKLTQK